MNKLDRYNFRFWDEDFGYKFCALGDRIPTDKSILNEYEQCTGLKDKNGRLIFEGDIVRQISKREPEYEEYITEVKWCVFGYPLYDEESFDYEVIGNIHTTPDLMEE
jgi:uncharacterized phage protein (TIGR01671 family)